MNAEQSLPGPVNAALDLEFTGERIVPGKTAEALFREHEERYVFAGQYVAGKDVLDVACGTGVGTAFLRSAGARRVWGLDIAADAIAYAQVRYPECQFTVNDATNLSLDDESVDVVVSFETLEHIGDQQRFLKECQRVLRPGGLLICSTPNTTVYRWQGVNSFHVHELRVREFEDLVLVAFRDLLLFSQSEKVYPLYLLRSLASRALDKLQLKRAIKNVLGRKLVSSEMRNEFCDRHGSAIGEIRPYRSGWCRQPTYLIAVARRPSS